MGVSGFTTFLDNNNYLLTDFKLRDIKLVVDGNNFYHFVYHFYQVPYVYGGDYKQFVKICSSFFKSLLLCKITPYVVFDGAYDLTDIKFKGAITRAGKKLIAASSCAHGELQKVLPLLTHEVFINVLNEFKIKHVTCNFEADKETACLAASFNCPVLTNDSDFFVCDLPGGVILLDYLDVAPRKDADNNMYMRAQLFKVQDLVKHMKLPDTPFVALFASVLGNDIVDKTVFETFLAKFTSSKGHKAKHGRKSRKISGFLKWLAGKKNIEEAINDIIGECALDKRAKLHALVRTSMSTYSVSHTSLEDVFENYEDFSNGTFKSKDCMVNKFDEECPGWFQWSLNKGDLSSRVVNLWMSNKVILQPQVEANSQVSSHLCSRRIRMLLHALVTGARKKEFREYIKVNGKLSRNIVKTNDYIIETLPSFENLPETPDLADVYVSVIPGDGSLCLKFAEEYRLVISALQYWCINTRPCEKALISLLLAVFVPEVLLKMVPFKAAEDVEDQLCEHLANTKQRNKYFDIGLVHSFNQFQSCLQSLMDLNSLLGRPLTVWNCPFNSSCLLFMHHFLQVNACNIQEYLQRLYTKVPTEGLELVLRVHSELNKHLTSSASLARVSKRSKRNRKNKKTNIVVEEMASEAEEEKEDDDYEDLENRFSILKLSCS